MKEEEKNTKRRATSFILDCKMANGMEEEEAKNANNAFSHSSNSE
jgi:hypothetical protein